MIRRLFLAATILTAPMAVRAQSATMDTVAETNKAIAAIRAAYDQGRYTNGVAIADSAMRKGLGSPSLQTWRLASQARLPGVGAKPLRSARRMASMYPDSAWAWVGLALTAAIVPDSVSVATQAAAKAVQLAPGDSLVKHMTGIALEQAKATPSKQ